MGIVEQMPNLSTRNADIGGSELEGGKKESDKILLLGSIICLLYDAAVKFCCSGMGFNR